MIVFKDEQRNVRVEIDGGGYVYLVFEPDIESARVTFEIPVRVKKFGWWERRKAARRRRESE